MIAIENNQGIPEMRRRPTALEVRFHFVDGSKETFVQADARAAEAVRDQINQAHLFHQSRIVVADDYSKSVFVCAQINRIDLVFDSPSFSRIPPDHAELVELTEAEFRQLVPVN